MEDMYVDNIIGWFQNKVADYDLQIWEKSVVRRELHEELTVEGSRKAPVPEHLIDLDLVQGNTFAKAQPVDAGLTPWTHGIMLSVFMPLNVTWWKAGLGNLSPKTGQVAEARWKERTSLGFTMFLICIWLLMAFSLTSYYASEEHSHQVPLSEVIIPVISLVGLSVLHCVISQTKPLECKTTSRQKTSHAARRTTRSKTLRRCSIFSDIGPFAGLRKMYAKHSETPSSDSTSLDAPNSKSSSRAQNCRKRRSRPLHFQNENQFLRKRNNFGNDQISDDGDIQPLICRERQLSSSSSSTGESPDNDSDINSDYNGLAPDVVKPGPERIHVRLWESNHWVKASVSLVDLGALIMRKVFQEKQTISPFCLGLLFAFLHALLPMTNRIYRQSAALKNLTCRHDVFQIVNEIQTIAFAGAPYLVICSAICRFSISAILYFLLSISLRVYSQRLLAAKHFSHLTSARRARKSDLPHFRLNKVRNIKLWLSLRSYIRRRGAQRSVDILVSSGFLLVLCHLSTLAISFIHGNIFEESSPFLWEVTFNSITSGIFMMQILTQGSKINQRYMNSSGLITEQINLYLRMDRKPHKKEALSRANAVLGLAVKLIKEIESPFKVYGLVMSPLLYNVTRMIILSAFSGAVSEMLGIKLKLWKIKG